MSIQNGRCSAAVAFVRIPPCETYDQEVIKKKGW